MTQCDQTGKGPSEKEAIRLFTCSRERRYKAAVAISLAAYTYSVMAPAERAASGHEGLCRHEERPYRL